MGALLWSGQLANSAETASSPVTIDGQVLGEVTRTNNTIQIYNIQLGMASNTSGVFWDWEWQGQLEVPRGAEVINGNIKGRTGTTVIRGNWYWSGGAFNQFGAGPGGGSFDVAARWRSDHYGVAGGYRIFSVGYPGAGGPSIDAYSGTTTGTKTAVISWSNSVGAYCTYQQTIVEWGTTPSYGASGSWGQVDSAYLSGLSPGTTYYYRITAINNAGLTAQATGSFITKPSGGLLDVCDF